MFEADYLQPSMFAGQLPPDLHGELTIVCAAGATSYGFTVRTIPHLELRAQAAALLPHQEVDPATAAECFHALLRTIEQLRSPFPE